MTRGERRDGLQHIVRDLDRSGALLARDDRLPAIPNSVKERLELELQRFVVTPLKLLDRDRRPRARLGLTTANHAVTRLKIDR
jgi:hypothetical protein